MIRRNLSSRIYEALADTPVVALVGARQTGKTTLVQQITATAADARYLSLDDATTRAAASADPTAFVQQSRGLLVVDEVQKVPDLLSAIKVAVDRDRRPGRFLLTGSAHVLVLPRVSESLAGRMEILRLRPFSRGELAGHSEGFIDRVFEGDFTPPPASPQQSQPIHEMVLVGGYPEVVERPSARRREAWLGSYVTAILERDVRDLASIEGLARMPILLGLLAARSGSPLNKAELARASGLAYTTLERYLALLEATFLIEPLQAWSANLSKRLVRSRKVFLGDSGLTAQLTGVGFDRWQADPNVRGSLVETFVVSELHKQASWSDLEVSLSHYRSARREVDVVLEDRAGRIVGVEIKAGASLGRRDFAGLEALADDCGDRFVAGVILYGGDETLPFGPHLWALPLPALWSPLER